MNAVFTTIRPPHDSLMQRKNLETTIAASAGYAFTPPFPPSFSGKIHEKREMIANFNFDSRGRRCSIDHSFTLRITVTKKNRKKKKKKRRKKENEVVPKSCHVQQGFPPPNLNCDFTQTSPATRTKTTVGHGTKEMEKNARGIPEGDGRSTCSIPVLSPLTIVADRWSHEPEANVFKHTRGKREFTQLEY